MRASLVAVMVLVGLCAGCASGGHARSAGSNTLETVVAPGAPAAIGPYSHAVVAGGLLFTAGQIALDPQNGQLIPGDVMAQTERVMANLAAVLGARGATWADVTRVTLYVQDLRDFNRINEVYARVLGPARPARSTVQVAALPRGALIEMDLIAVVH